MEQGQTHADRKTYWQRVVAAWQASGLTKKAFCEQKQINYYSLLRWHKRLGVDGDAQPEHFVEVPTTVSGRSLRSEGDMARTTPIEIVIGTVVVRVPAEVELGHLQVVLTALEQRPC